MNKRDYQRAFDGLTHFSKTYPLSTTHVAQSLLQLWTRLYYQSKTPLDVLPMLGLGS